MPLEIKILLVVLVQMIISIIIRYMLGDIFQYIHGRFEV